MNTTTTNKNFIALDFMAMDHKKGSFKAFSDAKILKAKESIRDGFLSEKLSPNDKPILIHWHNTMLKILKKRVLKELINSKK